ncbi:hypothetical protein GCM10009548_73520 [Streptomyces malaysiensis subsp. malaysiensis]
MAVCPVGRDGLGGVLPPVGQDLPEETDQVVQRPPAAGADLGGQEIDQVREPSAMGIAHADGHQRRHKIGPIRTDPSSAPAHTCSARAAPCPEGR